MIIAISHNLFWGLKAHIQLSSFILCLFTFQFLFAQDVKVHNQYLFPITQNGELYSGDGIDWIMKQSTESHFILFGEQHGVKGLTQFVTAMYKNLHSEGYTNLILEMDNWTIGQIENNGLEYTINHYPHSIAFDYNEDLKLIETATDLSGKNQNQLWGVDQMVTSIHPFQRLIELAEDSGSKRLARGAYLKAVLKMGEYLREDHFRDLEVLEDAFKDNKSEEAMDILRQLKVSMNIYTKWRSGQRGEISKIVSPKLRETYMKRTLDSYLVADSSNSPLPKAVFKMGGAHTMYGIGPNGMLTLGEYAKELAKSKGHTTLSISIRAFNPRHSLIKPEDLTNSELVLIDTKAYLEKMQKDSIPLSKDIEADLIGFDALIYLKDGQKASRNIIIQNESNFETNFIKSLVPFVTLALILIIAIIVFIIKIFKTNERKIRVNLIVFSIGIMAILSIFTTQILRIIDYPNHPATVLREEYSIWIFVALLLISIYLIYSAVIGYRDYIWSKRFKISYFIFALSFLGLSIMMYWWNIGGMLGV